MKYPKEIQKIIDNQGKTEAEMRKLLVEIEDIFTKYANDVEKILKRLRP